MSFLITAFPYGCPSFPGKIKLDQKLSLFKSDVIQRPFQTPLHKLGIDSLAVNVFRDGTRKSWTFQFFKKFELEMKKVVLIIEN